MTLYELTNQYEFLMNCLYDEDYDEETLIDTLEGIEGEIEDKADGYARILKQMEKDAAAYKEEEERMAALRRTLENRHKFLKDRLYQMMKATGKAKFKTNLFSFGIQKNPPSLVIDNPDDIPRKYMIPQEPKVDTAAIKDLLKTGTTVSFAHLEQGERVNIR